MEHREAIPYHHRLSSLIIRAHSKEVVVLKINQHFEEGRNNYIYMNLIRLPVIGYDNLKHHL